MSATQNLKMVLNARRLDRKSEQLSRDEKNRWKKLYTQGAAAYGSVQSLKKASILPKTEGGNYLAQMDAHTKVQTPGKKFLDSKFKPSASMKLSQ